MTDKYKRFWVTDHTDNSGLTVTDKYNHKTMFGACNVHEVIERAALDEAVGLLKHTLNTFQHKADGMGEVAVIEGIEDFLKGLGE